MRPQGERGRARLVVATLGALGVSNVVVNRALPDAAYVPWNLALTAGLGWLAHRGGLGVHQLGLEDRQLITGLRTGSAAAGVVTLAYGFALTRRDLVALSDRRVTQLRPGQAWFQALVRIPLGTVVAEEFAFRGVLPALLRSPRFPGWVPGAVSSLLFGFWHVLPSRDLAAANAGAGRLASRVGRVGAVSLAVASTTAAGGVLQALRHRGRHLAAPVVAHWASNALGLAAARAAGRR